MRIKTRTLVYLFIYLSALVVVFYFLGQRNFRFNDLSISRNSGSYIKYEFSFKDGSGKASYTVKAELDITRYSPAKMLLLVDDCITGLSVNGKEVLANISDDKICYGKGKVVDTYKFFSLGRNAVKVDFVDYGGGYGLKIENGPGDQISKLLYIVLSLALIGLCNIVLSGCRCEWYLRLLIFGLIASQVYYLSHTSYDERSHDTGGHYEYIEHVAKTNTLPRQDVYEGHQAPLFYLVMAQVHKVANVIGFNEVGIQSSIMFVNNIVFIIGIVAAYFLFRLAFEAQEYAKYKVILALLFIFLSPAVVFASVRVNNDGWLFVATLISLLAFLKFTRHPSVLNAMLFGLALGLALLVKKNALVLLSLPFVAVSCPLWKSRGDIIKFRMPREVSGLIKYSAMVVVVIGIICGWYYYRLGLEGTITVVNPSDQVKIENNVDDFLIFQPAEIIKNPFVDSFSDKYRRNVFWETLYKTWLFGEYSYDDLLTQFKKAISFSGLFVTFVMLVGIFGKRFNGRIADDLCYLTFGIVLLLSVGSLLYYRISHPYACNQDFRFILCAVPSLGYYFAEGVFSVLRWKLPVIRVAIVIGVVIHFVLLLSFLAFLIRV